MAYKSNSNKFWTGFLAVLLALVLAGTAALIGVLSDGFKDWSKFKPDEEQTEQTDETAFGGGAIVNESEGNGISLMSAKIEAANYDEYGVDPLADSAYSLTATVTPANATNKTVDWTLAWVNPNSSWAKGKTVTDYASITPSGDGALTASFAVKKAFGEQMKIVCTSRQNTQAKAECTVDYAKRVTAGTLSLNGAQSGISGAPSSITASLSGSSYKFNVRNGYDGVDLFVNSSFTPTEFSEGTVEDTFSYTFSYSFSAEWIDALESYFSVDVTAGKFYTMGQLHVGTFIGVEAVSSMESVLMGDFATGGSAGYYIQYVYALRDLDGKTMSTIKVSGTGKYSSFTATCNISADPSAFDIFVSGLSLDKASIVV